jgi:hypothetical protein
LKNITFRCLELRRACAFLLASCEGILNRNEGQFEAKGSDIKKKKKQKKKPPSLGKESVVDHKTNRQSATERASSSGSQVKSAIFESSPVDFKGVVGGDVSANDGVPY